MPDQAMCETAKGSALLRKPGSIPALDGWRGISILCVLACHMLPLGPKKWELNACAGPVGMSLFFTLSGFLITSTLIERLDVRAFFIRRACRILPLAWLYMLVVLALLGKGIDFYIPHLLFFLNYDFAHLTELTGHLWSLCVEAQFYLFVGLLAAVAGKRGLAAIPLFCLGITALRIVYGQRLTIVTHFRVDEILAGASLALMHHGLFGVRLRSALSGSPQTLVAAILLLLASHPATGPLNYVRPYCAAALVGSTLWRSDTVLHRWLASGFLKYVAALSYALYVIHPLTMHGWLGSGGKAAKYLLKRPISFALTFGFAHVSTYYYEQRWINWGKSMINKRRHRDLAAGCDAARQELSASGAGGK